MAKKKSILDIYKMKQNGEKISWITSYDAPIASFAEQAGMDMILVGDSMGMVVFGFEGTNPVTMDMCISHCQAVRRGAPNTFIVGDMPFGSYQISDEDAAANAIRFVKEGNVDAIKLEGGKTMASRMTEKGLLRYEGKPRRYYPNVTREEAGLEETEQLLSRAFGGRLGLLVSNFADHGKIGKDELEELYAILDKAAGRED